MFIHFFRLLSVIGLFTITSGCASNQIIQKSEYNASIDELKSDHIGMALNKLPKKEKNHFITLVEKVYLQLINSDDSSGEDTSEFKKLLAQSREIERNEKTSISNEIDQLFFVKTNEGYFPANHEIFWMHYVLGLTFIKKKQIEKARVEAKRISELFARVGLNGRPFYDNPSIRMLSASLWALCGEKESALVDLRHMKQWSVPPIVINESDPLNWDITFKGVGFYPETDTSSFSNKLSGFQAIKFKSTIKESDLAVTKPASPSITFTSQKWHSENLVRNDEFKDTIQKSKYMSRMFKSEFEYQSLNLLTSVAAGTVLAAGITVGAAIIGGGIYFLVQLKDSADAAVQIMSIGFLVGGEIYEQGTQFYSSTQSKIQSERKDYQDVSRFYRYVRFIPDYFILNSKPNYLEKTLTPFVKSQSASGTVRIFFQP